MQQSTEYGVRYRFYDGEPPVVHRAISREAAEEDVRVVGDGDPFAAELVQRQVQVSAWEASS